MTLHHVVTIYLLAFSYIGNYFIGAPVLLIHNFPDIFISWCRAWADTTWSKVAEISFIPMLAIWMYTRLYCFGVLIYETFFKLECFMTSPYTMVIFCLLLSSLIMLHTYWTSLAFVMLHRMMNKGVLEDLARQTTEESSKGAQDKKAVMEG